MLILTRNPGRALFSLAKYGSLLILLAVAASGGLRAASEPALVTMIGKNAIMLDAPYPFVESSKLLPDIYAQRKKNMAATNQLIAWYVPVETARDLLGDKVGRYRSLQIQVLRAMEEPSYTPDDIIIFRDDLKNGASNMAVITNDNIETAFNVYDLSGLEKTAGSQRILGISELAPNSFTLCIATSVETIDKRGGSTIEASISAVTYLLLRDKIILISVTGPEISARELRNAFRITRDWVRLLNGLNLEIPNVGKPASK